MKTSKARRKPRYGLIALLAALVLLTGALLGGLVNARTVRVVYGVCPLTGLDYRLDGLRILYVSDLKIATDSDAEHALRLLRRLNELEPDLILIGGDISGQSFANDLRQKLGITGEGDDTRMETAARDKFLLGMNEIKPKYGVYAVKGDTDAYLSDQERARSSIRFLYDEEAYVNIDGAFLPIYGGEKFDLKPGAGPMIIMFHDPSQYSRAAVAASRRDSEPGSYLFLSAHLLGGQSRIGDYFAKYGDLNREYTSHADQYGIYSDGSGFKMLLSSGIGTVDLPLRYFTAPNAYLITLRRA